MNIPWGKVLAIVARIASAIVVGVPSVETIGRLRGGTSGADKRRAVLELVQAELHAAELAAGRDLTHDPDVLAAAGGVVDAYVALINTLARATAPAVPDLQEHDAV